MTIVVETKAPRSDVFHVSSFDTSSSAQSAQAPHNGPAKQDEDMTEFQQATRPSIVPGVESADLLKMHRQSLAQLSGANQMEFSGVTLSRRHTTRKEEYDAGVETETQKDLEGFSFGE